MRNFFRKIFNVESRYSRAILCHSERKILQKIWLIGGNLTLLIFLLPAQAQQTNSPKIQTWSTSKGVPVFFVERQEIPMIDIAVIFSAGSAYDHDKWGVAALTSATLREGTKDKVASQIAAEFDQVGAQYSADVDLDSAIVSLRTLTQHHYLQAAMHTFLDVLANPTFPQASFLRTQQQTFDAINQNLQDPTAVANEQFYQTTYANQPYGHPVLGTLDSVKKIQREDVVKFYHQYYVAKNAKIIIVGAVNRAKAEELAEAISTQLQVGQKASPLATTTQVNQKKVVFKSMPVSQNTVIIGQNGVTRLNPDYYNLLVANYVLGGSPLTSLLFDEIRTNQGLVYDVHSGFTHLLAKGPFMVVLQTRSEKTNQAISLVNHVLASYLKNGPSQSQLDSAKLNLLGSFPLKLSSNSGILSNLMNIAFYNLPLDYLEKYPENIRAITTGSAKQAFDKVIKMDQLNTVVVGSHREQG